MDFIAKLLDVVSKLTLNLVVTIGIAIGGLIKLGLSYVLSVSLGFPIGVFAFFILLGFHFLGTLLMDLGTKKMKDITDNWDTMPKKGFYLFVGLFLVVSFLFVLGTAYGVTLLAS